MLLVLSLLLVLAAVALPGIGSWQRRQTVDQAIAVCQQVCQQARIDAIQSASPKLVRFNNSARRIEILDENASRSLQVVRALPENCVCVEIADMQSRILRQLEFTAEGTATAARITPVLDDGKRVTLRLQRLTGTVTVCEPETDSVQSR